jgi:hypothetical protein
VPFLMEGIFGSALFERAEAVLAVQRLHISLLN